MSEMSEFSGVSKEVSEQSGASFVESEQALDDIKYMQTLVERGLPVDIRTMHDTYIELGKIEYNGYFSEQNEAKEHIDAARQLFRSSYEQSVGYTVQEARRIVAAYPNILYPNYGKIIDVAVVWQKDGSAVLGFQTDQNQTAN